MATMYKELPDKLFLVRVPIICTYDYKEMEILGMPTTYDYSTNKILDRKAHTNLTTCMLPLTKLIDIYNNGYEISLVNKDDVTTIYNLLDEYLTSMIAVKEGYVLNSEQVEEERIDGIERFAREMFGLNKGTIVNTMISSTQNTSFDLNFNMLKHKPRPKSATINPDVQPKKYSNTLPTNHTAYPMPIDQKSEILSSNIKMSVGNTANYSSTFTNIPTFNIDEIERKPTYRKRYK